VAEHPEPAGRGVLEMRVDEADHEVAAPIGELHHLDTIADPEPVERGRSGRGWQLGGNRLNDYRRQGWGGVWLRRREHEEGCGIQPPVDSVVRVVDEERRRDRRIEHGNSDVLGLRSVIVNGDPVNPRDDEVHRAILFDRDLMRDELVHVPGVRGAIRASVEGIRRVGRPLPEAHCRAR